MKTSRFQSGDDPEGTRKRETLKIFCSQSPDWEHSTES